MRAGLQASPTTFSASGLVRTPGLLLWSEEGVGQEPCSGPCLWAVIPGLLLGWSQEGKQNGTRNKNSWRMKDACLLSAKW